MPYSIEHDPNKCDGCLSCVDACGKAHHFPPGKANCRILKFKVVEGGETKEKFAYVVCMQCRKPKCTEVCPTAAMRREDTIVILEEARCVGCVNCIFVCPWGIPVFNEETGKVSKCDLCFHRVNKGEKPYCVAACPNEALRIKKTEKGIKKPSKKIPTKRFSAVASPPGEGKAVAPPPSSPGGGRR